MDIQLRHLKTFAFGKLPKPVQALAQTAFHQIIWNDDWDEAHFYLAEEMIQTCVALAGPDFNGRPWLLALQQKNSHNSQLGKLWPVKQAEFDGRIYSRGLKGRLFAAVALWRIDLALEALSKRRSGKVLEEVAYAGMALHFAGMNDAYHDSEVNQTHQRRRGSAARWESDPTQQARMEIRAEWERWQLGACRYQNDEDFGRKMHARFGAYKSERSISNLARKWRGRGDA